MRRANQHAGITGLAALVLWAGCGPGWAQPATTPARFEGAVGLTLRQGPAFSGSSESDYRLTPAGFLRYGRITLNGSGGFTTRDADDVESGLAAELVRRGSLRFRLGLRIDGGRSASDSPELAGTGDIRRTVRARWSARWDPNPQWRLTGGVSADLLGRGGGVLGDLAATRRWSLGDGESLVLNVGLGAAGKRYMQNWYGLSATQSLDAGLPAFEAAAGLRELNVSVGWRTEFQAWGQPFGASLGAGYTRLLGSAADSPLTRRPGYATASGAVVWRF